MGKVFLVGAGPGDPVLLTVKARRILESADVVVHDRLVSAEILALAAHDTLIDGGKHQGEQERIQVEINRLLVRLARAGRRWSGSKAATPWFSRAARRSGNTCWPTGLRWKWSWCFVGAGGGVPGRDSAHLPRSGRVVCGHRRASRISCARIRHNTRVSTHSSC